MSRSVQYSRSVFKLLYCTTENKKYTIIRGMKKWTAKPPQKKKSSIAKHVYLSKTAYYFMSLFWRFFVDYHYYNNIGLQITLPKISCCPPSQKTNI